MVYRLKSLEMFYFFFSFFFSDDVYLERIDLRKWHKPGMRPSAETRCFPLVSTAVLTRKKALYVTEVSFLEGF